MKSEWRIRIVGERDRNLGSEAYRLLCRILSFRVFEARKRHEDLWEPFPITWTMVGLWLGLAERRCYYLLGELQARGYLQHTGVFGCPGQAHYRLVEAMADNPPFKKGPDRAAIKCSPRAAIKCGPGTAKKCSPSSAEKCSPSTAKKGGRLNKYSLREEMKYPEGRNSSLRSNVSKTGNNGSLRSKEAESLRQRQHTELGKLKAKLKGGEA